MQMEIRFHISQGQAQAFQVENVDEIMIRPSANTKNEIKSALKGK